MQYSSAAQLLETAKDLFMDVVCAFYTDAEYVVADYLVRNKYLSEKDVADDRVLKLHHKFAKRALNKLEETAMIQSFKFYSRFVDSTGNITIKSDFTVYYYINYDHFVNVLTYRLYQMYQVQVTNESYNRSSDKERFECESPSCGQRYRIVDIVDHFSESDNFYFCPLCRHRLRELEDTTVEESAETMQEKIKAQVNTAVSPFHPDLIGTLELLKGQQIHPIHPQESIERELKEKCSTGLTESAHPFISRGGGGRRSSSTLSAAIEIRVEIEKESSEKKMGFQRILQPLPPFLIHSTVEETERRNRRMRVKNVEQFSEEEDLECSKGLFD